jgi:hypothetical protein
LFPEPWEETNVFLMESRAVIFGSACGGKFDWRNEAGEITPPGT